MAAVFRYPVGVEWSEDRHWRCNNNVHPSRHGTYDGITMHPFETVFIKASWHVGEPHLSHYTRCSATTCLQCYHASCAGSCHAVQSLQSDRHSSAHARNTLEWQVCESYKTHIIRHAASEGVPH